MITHHIGTIATGATLIDSLVSGGSLKTVQGFQPPLTSVVEHGEDFINIDNDGKRMRLNGKILAKCVFPSHIFAFCFLPASLGLVEVNAF